MVRFAASETSDPAAMCAAAELRPTSKGGACFNAGTVTLPPTGPLPVPARDPQMSARDPQNILTKTLGGQFVVEAFAGEGRFGVLYKGSQLGREGAVAIKTIKLDLLLDATSAETFLARLRDESQAQSKILQDQALVARSVGTGMIISERGSHTPYAVYEWLDGRSLASSLHDDDATALPLADAVALLGPCVEAIAGAHDLGLFHGDINAGNIFVTNDAAGPTLNVLDFGLAALVRRVVREMAPDAADTNMFSMVHGSPEHFDRSLGPIGPATDVYCIALVLLEVMGLPPPDPGATFAELSKRALDPLNRATPRAFNMNVGDCAQAVLARAVACAPSERWVDAGELWEALKAAIEKDRKRQQAMTVPPPTNVRPIAAPAATEDGGQTFFEPLPPAHLLAAIQQAIAAGPSKVKSTRPKITEPRSEPAAVARAAEATTAAAVDVMPLAPMRAPSPAALHPGELPFFRPFTDEPTVTIARLAARSNSDGSRPFFQRPLRHAALVALVAGGVGSTVFVIALTALLLWRAW